MISFVAFFADNESWDGLDDIESPELEQIILYHLVQSDVGSIGQFSTTFARTAASGDHGHALTTHVQTASDFLVNGSVSVASSRIDASNGAVYASAEVLRPATVVDLLAASTIVRDFYYETEDAHDGDISFRDALSEVWDNFTLFVPTNDGFSAIAGNLVKKMGFRTIRAVGVPPHPGDYVCKRLECFRNHLKSFGTRRVKTGNHESDRFRSRDSR